MSAIHGWALILGAGALALPLAIHLLTRARGIAFVYPTYRFVAEAAAARRRTSRIRDLLVLLLRILAVGALSAAFARPLIRAPEAAAAPLSERGRWALIVLDASESMKAQLEGPAPFALAQREARAVLDAPELRRADLVIGAQRPRSVFGKLSVNLGSLRQELDRAHPLPEAFDPSAALAEAATLLRELSAEERREGEIVVLTDLQRSNWATASFAALPADVAVRVVRVRDGAVAPPNVAVLRARAAGLASVGRPFTITLELLNAGTEPAARTLEFSFEEQSFRRAVTLLPGVRREESFLVTPTKGGAAIGTARLTGARDALADDDARSVAVLVREACRIVLATTDAPGAVGRASYFVDRAIGTAAESGFKLDLIRPSRLEGDLDPLLARADLLILVDPGRLPRPAIETVARLLSRGLPLLYALQGPSDADVLAELEALLGPALRLPSAFVPLDRGAASRFIVWADPSSRPFRIFGSGIDRFTRDLVLSGGLRTVPRDNGEEDRIRARLSDGSSALLLAPAGLGRLALLNLPLSGPNHAGRSALVVPLLQEIALDLLETPSAGGNRAGICGQAFVLPLAEARVREQGLSSWKVVDEDGKAAEGPRLTEDKSGPLLLWNPADRPGSYRVLGKDRVEDAFTVGIPSEESDLTALEARLLEERIARGRSVRVSGIDASDPARKKDRELWPWFAAAALACFLLEIVALKAFRT